MKPFAKSTFKIGAGIAAVACLAALTWYFSPAAIEGMDRLNYCTCGYSEVRFAHGRILMVKHFHDDPSPGADIGGYSQSDADWDIEIRFDGKIRHEIMGLDHIGLLAPEGTKRRYYAFDSRSPKIRIYHLLYRLGLVDDYT